MSLMYEVNTLNAAMIQAAEVCRQDMPEGEKVNAVLACFAGMKPVEAVAADEYEHLLRRLRHLLKSHYISTFDAVHPLSHEYIRDIAEADGRPVVQCWECKRRGTPYDCPFRHLVHTAGRGYHYIDATTDDGYCSFGERKGAEA